MEPAREDLRDPSYLKIRDLVCQDSGIYHPEEKLYLLASRCVRRMAAVGAKTPTEYLAKLTSPGSRETELQHLLNEITIGETYMFRCAPQLRALRNIVLPQIVQGQGSSSTSHLRVWSAGCSTGEEPYTLAMFLFGECRQQLAGWTFQIVATDVNDDALAAARSGIYGEYALRSTPKSLRKAFFRPRGADQLQVNDQLMRAVRFERLNLCNDETMRTMQGMDIIFCCNVLIYFDLDAKRRVIRHFFRNLVPGGYLFLGNAESLFQVDDQFRLVRFPGAIGYRKPCLADAGRKSPGALP